MGIQAIALLRLPRAELSVADELRVDALEDGLLLYTRASFASEPVELSLALHGLLGDALAKHEDARGIFFIPDVAAPRARSYEAVVEEIGEGGVWAPLVDATSAGDEGEFGALLGNLLGQMPSSLLAAAQAAAAGQPGAFEAVSAQLQNMLRNESELAGVAEQLAGLMGGPNAARPDGVAQDVPHTQPALTTEGGDMAEEMAAMAQLLANSGVDVSSPAFSELAQKMEAEFSRQTPPEAEPASKREPKK